MAEHDGGAQAGAATAVQQAVRADAAWGGFIEQYFEPSGRARDLAQRHQATRPACDPGAALAANSRTSPANISGRVIVP